jgi:hypothetical protein
MKNIIREIRNLPYNIKNILGWLKILWNNFDWDHSFLLDILEYKLSKMKTYFENDAIIVREEADDIVEQLNSCIEACKQLKSEEYENEIFAPYYEKYPIKFDTWTDENGIECTGLLPLKDKKYSEWMKLHKLSIVKNKELRNQLFDTMKDNFDAWWD